MTIAFFSHGPFSKKLGATKNRIELAEGLQNLGWKTFLVSNQEIGLHINTVADKAVYSNYLKAFLLQYADQYDVVLYEYDTLPFPRTFFTPNTLFVARPALLRYNDYVKIPVPLKVKLSDLYRIFIKLDFFRKRADNKKREIARETGLLQCDLIQVQNNKDAELLIKKGYDKNKIIIIPNGISKERKDLFSKIQISYTAPPKVAFVGTFDFRKGANDFPFIFNRIMQKHPDCKFKLLGTQGMFTTADQVLNFFPRTLRERIEVISTFEPLELPQLLSDCQIGIFPTYYESFGFGALEMMCAGIPVVSYGAAGPSDFILKDLLVPIGDKKALANKVSDLFEDTDLLQKLSTEARAMANRYDWEAIARKAAALYEQHVRRIRKEKETA